MCGQIEEINPDDELCTLVIGDGEGCVYKIPAPPDDLAEAAFYGSFERMEKLVKAATQQDGQPALADYCVRLTICTNHAFNVIVQAANEAEAYEKAEKCSTRHVAKMEILWVGEPESPAQEAIQPIVKKEQFRMVEWDDIGNVVFAINEAALSYDDLLDLLNTCSRIGVRGCQFDEEDLESDGPLPSLLKVLSRLIIIRDLYCCDAFDSFSLGSYSKSLPPLLGQHGIRLVKVDTSQSGLHSLFVGKPYTA